MDPLAPTRTAAEFKRPPPTARRLLASTARPLEDATLAAVLAEHDQGRAPVSTSTALAAACGGPRRRPRHLPPAMTVAATAASPRRSFPKDRGRGERERRPHRLAVLRDPAGDAGQLAGPAVGYLGGGVVARTVRAEWIKQPFQWLSRLGLAGLAFASAELVGTTASSPPSLG